MRFKAVIFDLDGTLVNSLEDLADSVNEMLAGYGYPPHSVESYKQRVGNGAYNLIWRSLPDDTQAALLDEALQKYKAIYEQRFLIKTRPYDGILPLLIQLRERGIALAVCTNKHDDAAQVIVRTLFPAGTFRYVYGERKELPRKPAPDAALEIARRMAVRPEEAVYIGDSMVDMQTGVNAGMLPVGVLWGFRARKELEENGARLILAHPAEFLDKLRAMDDREKTEEGVI